MDKAFHYQTIVYSPLLKAEKINFTEDDKWLYAGKPTSSSAFVIYISCRTLDTPQMLRNCLPLLRQSKAIFRLIKSQNLQYRLNSGTYGDEETGKVLTVFPRTEIEVVSLVKALQVLIEGFKGPVVPEAQRISETIYIQKVVSDQTGLKFTFPELKVIPVPVPKAYLRKAKRNAILGGCYLPISLLRASSKGNIYKAINLRRLAFNWCLIKQGNPVALDDHFDRDMKDRLIWQKEIIGTLRKKICTPGAIDFFESKESSYLVLEFADGESYGHHVRKTISGTEWKKLEIEDRRGLAELFIQAAILVETIHENGVVHRDVTDSNFIMMEDGRLCIIDFELSFSLVDLSPNPPFLLGTFGYASPEQLNYHFPDAKDDIYSLGALLCFTLTGCQPHEFLNTTLSIVRTKLLRLSGCPDLTALVIKCLQPSRKDRPEIMYIERVIHAYLVTLDKFKNETVTMAL